MESNISIVDYCLNCGHYHNPGDWKKKPSDCEDCKCSPEKFVPRQMKRKFS